MPDSPASQDDPTLEVQPAVPVPASLDPAAVLRFATELGRLIGLQLAGDPTVESGLCPTRRQSRPRVP